MTIVARLKMRMLGERYFVRVPLGIARIALQPICVDCRLCNLHRQGNTFGYGQFVLVLTESLIEIGSVASHTGHTGEKEHLCPGRSREHAAMPATC